MHRKKHSTKRKLSVLVKCMTRNRVVEHKQEFVSMHVNVGQTYLHFWDSNCLREVGLSQMLFVCVFIHQFIFQKNNVELHDGTCNWCLSVHPDKHLTAVGSRHGITFLDQRTDHQFTCKFIDKKRSHWGN